MKRSRRDFLKGVFGAAGTLTLVPWKGFAQLPPILIGHQASLSGFLGSYGFWHNQAVKAALKKINDAGGVNGRQLSLVTVDGASNPNTSANVMEESLLGGDGSTPVDFVIGSVLSEANYASAPLARESRTPYFAQGVATDITGSKGNRWVFKSYHTVQGAVEGGWRWALQNLGTRWTIIHSELAFATSQAQAWKEKLGEVQAEVVDVISVPFDPASPPALSQYLNLIDTSRTQVLFQAFTARDSIAFMQQASALGLNKSLKVFGISEGVDALNISSPVFDNTYYISSYPRRSDQVPAALQALDQEYRQLIGIAADGQAASDPTKTVPIGDLYGSWQAVHLIQSAIEQTGWKSRDDHPSLILALEGFLYEASLDFPQGNGFIRANDHQAFQSHYIEHAEGGSLVVKATSSLDESFYVPSVDYRTEPF
ncbi:ABC transporter substrate-binding protein [Candidatus Acetothermia bacterium]|nr:ABC transporter substrate-binding protein [Candidatus Acetothermia bacterium]MBI3643917.1 ABC transporter substrate-binding protein [Candidatus Acetothermia bacterium]